MKKIRAIVRPTIIEEMKEALSKIKVNGITIAQVMGCGNQNGWKEYYRSAEVYMNILPKIQLSIVVSDEVVEDVIETIIRIARTGDVGDGKIFVSDVENVVRIRTGERGELAIN